MSVRLTNQIDLVAGSLIKAGIAFLLLFSSNSFATDLFDMLKRMSDADRNQSYQGTFILRKSDSLSTLRVAHGVGESGVWESIEMLNGEHKKVFRYDNRIVSVFPDKKLVTIRHTNKARSLQPQLPENIDQLELFYTLNRLSDDRVASRRTLVVELLPKDQYRYGYRYWIDKETGMLLRCDLVVVSDNKATKVIEQMMFVSLDYLTSSPDLTIELQQFSQFRRQLLNEPVVDVMQSAQQRWVVNALPDGFMLTQSTMRHSQPLLAAINESSSSSSESVASKTLLPDLLHLVYSDGLASVSVFIKNMKGLKSQFQGGASIGAVNAFGRPVGDYFVTVVGEVPIRTVESMANATVKLP